MCPVGYGMNQGQGQGHCIVLVERSKPTPHPMHSLDPLSSRSVASSFSCNGVVIAFLDSSLEFLTNWEAGQSKKNPPR